MSPTAGPGYCQEAAQQSEGMPSDFADENVYSLVSKPQNDISRGPRYRSKYAGRLDNKELSFGRREHKKFATMGLAKGKVTSRPEDFLRRHASHAKAAQGILAVHSKHNKMCRKAPLVSRTERPIMGLHSGQNCVHENAVKNIRMHPPPARPQAPRYVQKADYGRVPGYLQHNKAQIAKEKARQDALLLAAEEERASKILPEEERLQLVRQLKLKWAQINTQFLRLPFTLDTPAKRRRKEVYEAQLAQIEKDIRLLQHNEKIVVTGD
ncbi:hypothetical protein CVIRNUC_005996 [Coccomyxa viridis]|uniref:Enkurin domain-containing protein n=1 Tax=Coccomyxa viridis TaxID=1274662 RepID=A0AAV1I7D6_9CHLO|nr:hypothetical protein CVIRNUC_005996 [Coccomyxa viridis]